MRLIIPTQKTEAEYFLTEPGKSVDAISSRNNYLRSESSYWEDRNINYCFTTYVEENNNTGLGKLYQKHLDSSVYEDILVFMHDDVEIHDQFFYEKLKKAHETYDIVGLAGATRQEYTKDKPALWHTSCTQFRMQGNHVGEGRGFVAHKHLNYISSDMYGPSPAEAVFIDGLFMSFNVSRLKEVDFEFDQDFDWHHYDITTCLRAKEKGLKIGVWPIFVIHHGLGHWNNEDWHKSDKLFKEKYVK